MIFSVFQKNLVFGYSWSTRKPWFPMDKRPLVKGRIANFCISLDVFEFLRFGCFFRFSKKIGFWGILGPPGNHASWWIIAGWRIANFGIFQDVFEFLRFEWFFPFFKNIVFWGILGPPSYGIGATIRIGREMLCFPYTGFFHTYLAKALLF